MDKEEKLEDKILKWLLNEGYPLEFKTANIFNDFDFDTRQGMYVKDFKTQLPREIDVHASIDLDIEDSFLRISFITECKLSKDKPWIIFTDENSQISPSACIAQSISSKLFNSILWILAGDEELCQLSIFDTPINPGYNGRQAFGTNNDIVYSALQSVISFCFSEKINCDKEDKTIKDNFEYGILFIPLIVLDGKLFEVKYNTLNKNIEIYEKDKIRLHWKGAEAWKYHSTIDIITIDALHPYVEKLHNECRILFKKIPKVFNQIKECYKVKSLEPLDITPSARGIQGLPPLLWEMHQEFSQKSQ